jgi:hypothetical protein
MESPIENKKWIIFGFILISGILIIGLITLPLLIGTTGEDSIDDPLNEDSELIAKGELVRIDNNHYGEGNVSLVLVNETYVIQFKNVTIADGPDLYVYLSKKSSYSGTQDDPGDYKDLGRLRAQSGSFEVEVNKKINTINNYHSVLIWCKAFSVVFTYATLEFV